MTIHDMVFPEISCRIHHVIVYRFNKISLPICDKTAALKNVQGEAQLKQITKIMNLPLHGHILTLRFALTMAVYYTVSLCILKVQQASKAAFNSNTELGTAT